MLLLGQAADEVDIRGRSASGDTLLLLLNAGGDRAHTACREWSYRADGRKSSTRRSQDRGRGSCEPRLRQSRCALHACYFATRSDSGNEQTSVLGSTYRCSWPMDRLRGCPRRRSATSISSGSRLFTSRPILAAVPGSAHGYDVDRPEPTRPRARYQTRTSKPCWPNWQTSPWDCLVDIVPNHMAIDQANGGGGTCFASVRNPGTPTFDIDWAEHGCRVLVPISAGRLPSWR